jgi:hypothetical protein
MGGAIPGLHPISVNLLSTALLQQGDLNFLWGRTLVPIMLLGVGNQHINHEGHEEHEGS